MDSILHETDFNSWTQQVAQLLRDRRFDEIDIETLAEEVEGLGKSERRAISSYLAVLLTHLLKWKYQPSGRQYTAEGEPKGSWAGSIASSRIELQTLLAENPSLQSFPDQALGQSYRNAVKVANKETGLKSFPEVCPFTIEQILDENWWPND
jgi:Domain of unknown function DUF29